jgi:putative transcriptional regulator
MQGCLLVATPHLVGSAFARTVVLILHHDERGAVGLVLNRRLGELTRVVCRPEGGAEYAIDQPVYLGGPFIGPLVALHQEPSLSDYRVNQDIHLVVNVGRMVQLAGQGTRPVRYVLGSAGWGPRQLERELRQGVWHVLPGDKELVFAEGPDLWARCVRDVARRVYSDCVPKYDPHQNPCCN